VDWLLALSFVAGGVFGGWFGTRLAAHLAKDRAGLTRAFVALVFAVAGYMMWKVSPL
jgi:uncharacterized membrane protein YfcA